MELLGCTSNCIGPFAWGRLTASMPAETEAEKERVERLKSMSADKIAPLAVFLASDEAKEVSGQIFCVRKNEIFLFSVPRPIRSMHRAEGWTPQTIASDMLRSEEHTSELQSLMRNSYAVFCLKKNKQKNNNKITERQYK